MSGMISAIPGMRCPRSLSSNDPPLILISWSCSCTSSSAMRRLYRSAPGARPVRILGRSLRFEHNLDRARRAVAGYPERFRGILEWEAVRHQRVGELGLAREQRGRVVEVASTVVHAVRR